MTTDHRERALARLSLSAFLIDAALLLAVWKLGGDLLPKRGFPFALVHQWYWVGVPLGLIAYLFLAEIVFSGWSPGRFCCGLHVGHRNPAASTLGWRLKRFSSLLLGCGYAVHPNRLPACNCSAEVLFRSDITGEAPIRAPARSSGNSRPQSPAPASPSRPASAPRTPELPQRVEIVAGPHKGQSALLASGRAFAKSGEFRIGRDPNWADLLLTGDTQVSSRHCIVWRRGDRLEIIDGAGTGKGSTNGTKIGTVTVSATAPQTLPANATVTLGISTLLFR
ncbi:FHA domain-containing protein [Breoghania sp.]|uniref:FHA domain-containing protein n=1 Tax=Breoghania sp. TaxID=2065378 RepID=UPI002AABA588|nr:FHA domain-containing protein [Breoghania sp.]